jgi:hypothetical protein
MNTDEIIKPEASIIAENGYIKLIKNTKGYNWEIKIHENKDGEVFKKLIEQIDELNTMMKERFGNE